jgi:mannose-6-phosphate isomerase-like protein (cupin superfamily)
MIYKIILACLVLLIFASTSAQSVQNVDSIKAPAASYSVFSHKLAADSLVSSVLIYIEKEIKLHKHLNHSEHVYIIEGEADMRLGEKVLKVKKGDLIFIPQGTPHAVKVTSQTALKCISIQAPFFDGKDRVMLE